MSDLNKDIEKVKELQSTIYEGGEYIYLNKNDKQALGNVLKKLETRTVQVSGQVSGQVQELETWKKIAENIANTLSKEIYNKLGIRPRTEDLIEVARKEVENES